MIPARSISGHCGGSGDGEPRAAAAVARDGEGRRGAQRRADRARSRCSSSTRRCWRWRSPAIIRAIRRSTPPRAARPRNLLGAPGAWFADLALTLFGLPVALLLPVGADRRAAAVARPAAGRWGRMLRDRGDRRRADGDRARLRVDRVGAGAARRLGRRGRAGGRGRDRTGRSRLIGEPVGDPAGRRARSALVAGVAGRRRSGRAASRSTRRAPLAPAPPRVAPIGRRATADATDERRRAEPLTPTRKPPSRARSPSPTRAPARSSPIAASRRPPPSPSRAKQAASTCATITRCRRSTCSSRRRPRPGGPIDKAALERNARLLETVLDDFHVKGSIIEVRPGPVVTMYELEPAAGHQGEPRDPARRRYRAQHVGDLRARRDDPGAHRDRHRTAQRQARDGQRCTNCRQRRRSRISRRQLPLILGKNIAGDPVIADLAPMPHLLVAGTTGSGKSVGLNCMILSLLYRLTPDQCRMIMIDPKMLELSMYDDIPHLLVAGRHRSGQGGARAQMGGRADGGSLSPDVVGRRAQPRQLQRQGARGQGQGPAARPQGPDRL